MIALKFVATVAVSLLLLLALLVRITASCIAAVVRYVVRQLNQPTLGALRIASPANFQYP